MYFQMIAQHTETQTTTISSTWLNEQCNGVQHKGPGCARPYGRTAISTVLQFVHWSFSQHPHLQFKNTQWLETATKLTVHCLSETLSDHALCLCLSLFETSILKTTPKLLCARTHRSFSVCRFNKQVDSHNVFWDTGHVGLLVFLFHVSHG